MRVRLREARPEGEAAYYGRTYPAGYKHDRWPDHVERVAASVDLIRRYASAIHTAADLSCGDGAILRALLPELDLAWFGDLNGVDFGWVGALPPEAGEVMSTEPGLLPGALTQLPEPVDLFILSETIEHMDDPDALLREITRHSRYLFLSTPVDETADVGNPEHYWGWGLADIQDLLFETGWTPMEQQTLQPQTTLYLPNAYRFQLWMAVRT